MHWFSFFLGIELSQVFSPVWNSRNYSNVHLLGIVLLLTALLFVLRFYSLAAITL